MATLEMNIDQVNSDFNGIKTAITAKGVEVEDGTATSEYADKVTEVYEKGKQAEYDKFWDSYQNKGKSYEYNYAFYGARWNDTNFKPKYPFEKLHSAHNMFGFSHITELNVPLSFNTSPINLTSVFSQNSHIKKILLLEVNENVSYSNWFLNNTKLESVTFEGTISKSLPIAESTLLNKESILSIFSCLSDAATSVTLTLSQTAVNNAFETSSGLADGSTSEEWLNLVATKPNWTISLST